MTDNTMTILGIETSCDETGAAVIRGSTKEAGVELMANTLATSLPIHAATGGIIPEVAAREQLKYIHPVIDTALQDAQISFDEVDAIAVTHGPGLIGSLLVGIETAKTLAYILHKPLIPVNHLYGHIYANWLIVNSKWPPVDENTAGLPVDPVHTPYTRSHTPKLPALALVVSGGHTDLVLMKAHGDLTVLGGTRDDAAGEAFDKIGRLLGLPYPAGPIISELATEGDPKAFALPRPMIGANNYDFSFSGLKTAVRNLIKKNHWDFQNAPLDEVRNNKLRADLAASVEEAIIDTLVRKTMKAVETYQIETLILGGGVSANEKLRERFSVQSSETNMKFFAPAKNLSTDNAAMIAAAAFYTQNSKPWTEVTAHPELYY